MEESKLESDVDESIQQEFARGAPLNRAACEDASRAPHIAELHSLPSADEFVRTYVRRSMPVVIRGGVSSWRALNWSAETLREFENEIIQVAPLQVDGPHAFRDKFLEPADVWDHEGAEPEPEIVDCASLLVVSAGRVRMRLRKFFRLLADGPGAVAATFYADGAGNLEHSFGFLSRRSDFCAPACASRLDLKRVDLWMGGRSVSRMHFDNLDNLFAQLVGAKTFVLAPPCAGAALQGGRRLRKARREYGHPGRFTREGGGVLHETVLNYLGRDRPPSMPATAVVLLPGDLLYLPFGWWHEVHAHPDGARGGLCIGLSHFYHPYYCRVGGKRTATLGPIILSPRYKALDDTLGASDDDTDGDACGRDDGACGPHDVVAADGAATGGESIDGGSAGAFGGNACLRATRCRVGTCASFVGGANLSGVAEALCRSLCRSLRPLASVPAGLGAALAALTVLGLAISWDRAPRARALSSPLRGAMRNAGREQF